MVTCIKKNPVFHLDANELEITRADFIQFYQRIRAQKPVESDGRKEDPSPEPSMEMTHTACLSWKDQSPMKSRMRGMGLQQPEYC